MLFRVISKKSFQALVELLLESKPAGIYSPGMGGLMDKMRAQQTWTQKLKAKS